MAKTQSLCVVPWTTGFTSPAGGFRNCCFTAPPVSSRPDQPFGEWWTSSQLIQFKRKLAGDNLPDECYRCQASETANGGSYRLSANSQQDFESLTDIWPSRWNVSFGNTCNLACWSCSERSSSVIEQHKRQIGLLPPDYESSNDRFDRMWPDLRSAIMHSYDCHDTVHLTILGGEPLYSDRVLTFLQDLLDLGLAYRTRLEFHTNATQHNDRIKTTLAPGNWQYISMFLSIDSVGKTAEWLRYGSRWQKILHNIPRIRALADYTEVHTTLSIMNIMDLPDLKEFCSSQDLPWKVFLLAQPDYMAITNWDGDPQLILDHLVFDPELSAYYDLIGRNAQAGSRQRLLEYIKQFDSIRRPLQEFNPKLHAILHG